MFLFTTTTVINSLKDLTSGKDLVKLIEKDEDANLPARLQVKRLNNFDVNGILNVYKSEAVEAACDSADLTDAIAALDTDAADDSKPIYRIKVYVKSVGNVDPFFANDFVFKGKPLYIEFDNESLDGANKTITEIVKNGKKYLGNVCDVEVIKFCNDDKGEEPIKIIVDGGEEKAVYGDDNTEASKLYIVAGNEYQRFASIEIEKIVSIAGAHGSQLDTFKLDKDNTKLVTIVEGNEGFGTYDQLIKDFRLPTGANLRWKRTMEDEMPVAGSTYTQFIVYYCKNRGIMGLSAVGELVKSRTTHVFWVNDAIASDFETVLSSALAASDLDEKVTITEVEGYTA